VIWRGWHWSLIATSLLIAPFIVIDSSFFAANSLKIFAGWWVPLAFAAVVMTLMYTWQRGTRLLFEKTRRQELPLRNLVKSLEAKPPYRVPGTAVFLTSDPDSAPTALLHSLKHYKVLHEKNVILTVEAANIPRIAPEDRVRIEAIGETFSRVHLRFGFMGTPNVPKALAIARTLGWRFDIMSTSFFLSRRTLKPTAQSGIRGLEARLFIYLARSANDATDYFRIPTGRVVEVGTQIMV
jgi:KUP system potassium uptake protein